MTKLPIPLKGLVVDQEYRQSKNGKFFWQIMLKTTEGTIKCMMWDASANAATIPSYPHLGDLIAIDNFKDQLETHQNIVINSTKEGNVIFARITKDDLLPEEECILDIEKASKEEMEGAWNLITDSSVWANLNNYEFTMACLKALDQKTLNLTPAASKVHHNYQGGLIVHTSEVLDLCISIVNTSSKKYKFINRDVVYASAILHDLGKVKTYTLNDLGIAKKSVIELTMGHFFFGMYLIYKIYEEDWVDKVSLEFVEEVEHCVAAHHGTREMGSPIEPMSIEAAILSRCDYISSQSGKVENLIKENSNGTSIPEEFGIYGDKFFATLGIKSYIGAKQT